MSSICRRDDGARWSLRPRKPKPEPSRIVTPEEARVPIIVAPPTLAEFAPPPGLKAWLETVWRRMK